MRKATRIIATERCLVSAAHIESLGERCKFGEGKKNKLYLPLKIGKGVRKGSKKVEKEKERGRKVEGAL